MQLRAGRKLALFCLNSYNMTLRIDQLKNLKLPLNSKGHSCNSCEGNCGVLVSLYDVLTSFAAVGTTLYVDNTLTGNGSLANPLKIAQQSATVGQSLTWNGTTWVPANSTSLPTAAIRDQLVHNGTSFVKVTPHVNTQLLSVGTVATIPHVPSNLMPVDVYLNGLIKEEGGDYSIVSNTITFIYGFQNNDKLTIKYYT